MWQDIVIAVGSWVFIVALIPTLFSKHKPQVITSMLTGGILAVYAVVYGTMGLWVSVLPVDPVMTLLAAVWFVIGMQGIRRHRE